MKKKKQPFDYKVVVFVPSVDSMQQQTAIEARLKRDPEDNLLYLEDINTKGAVFKEIFPGENKKIYVNDELENLESKLKKLESDRKKLSNSGTDNYLNFEKEISNLRRLIAKLKEPSGTFAIQNSSGEKVIYFLRKSTGLSAVHFDIHSNQAYSPTEQQAKEAFNAWKTKYENLKDKPDTSFEKITATIASIVLILLCCGCGILFWNQLQHDSEWDKMMLTQKYICDSTAKEAAQKIYKTNEDTSSILNNYVRDNFIQQDPDIQSPTVSEIK